MPTVTFVQPDGSAVEVSATPGSSMMNTAVSNDVQGIVADCGGSLACATCHVYVDPADEAKFPPASEEEIEMLDEVFSVRHDNSRLSCQLNLPDTSEPITVTIPEAQW
ncbi:2Fe-2S iron-sulfur cluster-binding protein [Rhodococcus sp. NPDC019627]|uniref:2Fe-2S iron-sulfur cluster-binding protein n=1 Tax=unclassified Rhodococcus (in: high G+C Gram-positive bacteria) TaxID=192944 RepID=UPI0033C08F89